MSSVRDLTEADVVVVTDVYGAVPTPIPGVTGKLVVTGSLRSRRRPASYLPRRQDVVRFLGDEVRPRGRSGRHDGLRRRVDAGRRGARADYGRRRERPARTRREYPSGRRRRPGPYREFPLAPLTSFRLGGPAALYLEPESDADLAAAGEAIVAAGVPFVVIGKGSNILVMNSDLRSSPGLAIAREGSAAAN